MRLIIDGDGCPAKKEVINLAKKYQVEVILITSLSHYSDYSDCTYIVVDNLPQAVDMAVINRVQKDDLVITGDYGLAAIVLRKGAHVVSPRGKIYLEKKMDELLLRRHLAQKERRSGGRFKGPSKYTVSDKERLLSVLERFFRRKKEIFAENN
ncbi:hypothetical protein BBF96_06925 [Anoxybacter fermentans]|uniref:UPF0178 protein BBF96_06925 n=1 Tax=Anoxybacter fermentans TaxID=1323375 RepID=A0A3Q9HQJ2_9FIRM|nr:YaiI/YqxD family protein [Anoxybacter fermentans]AZR73140.1 hypothetical protein BBF96_06925 [Anoxybacter fermentans]